MRRFVYVTAAAMAVGGLGMMGCDNDADLTRDDEGVRIEGEVDAQPAGERMEGAANDAGGAIDRAADRTGDAAQRAADRTRDAAADTADRADRAVTGDGTMAPKGTAAAPDAEGIRDVLSSTTEAAFTKGGFDDLIERFVDADRNRIGEFTDADMADFDGLVAQIQKDWQAKYNNEFDIENEELVFGEQYVTIRQGEIGKDPQVASEVLKDTGTVTEETDEDKNVEEGRNIATATIKASHGMPDLTVPLVHEMPDNWRINVPDTVDGAKLKQNLMNHLTWLSRRCPRRSFGSGRDNWPPAEPTQAPRKRQSVTLPLSPSIRGLSGCGRGEVPIAS